MNYTVIITQQANKEYEELYNWYLDIDIKLGIKFSDEVLEALDKLAFHPNHYSFVGFNLRRILLKNMNAMLVYKIDKQNVEILSIKDTRSKPNKNFY